MKKKPFYKKWWVWLVAFLLLATIIGTNNQEENDGENNAEDQAKGSKKIKESNNDDYSTEKVDKEGSVTIEVDESVMSVDYTAKVQRVKVDDDVLTVVFDWENQSDWDPAHFPLLGYVVVEQGGEALEQIGDMDRQNKQIRRNRFDVYNLEYNLIDDSEITIRIVSTNEHDGSEGNIIVNLK